MIKIADGLWVGAVGGIKYGNLNALGVGAILNVAQDLQCIIGWDNGIEYMQVGLIDGPGNPISSYYSLVLALTTLTKRHKNVLVCCHEGGRSLAVVIMYLQTFYEHRQDGWDKWMDTLRERADIDLPTPHQAHADAFKKMNWQLLKASKEMGD